VASHCREKKGLCAELLQLRHRFFQYNGDVGNAAASGRYRDTHTALYGPGNFLLGKLPRDCGGNVADGGVLELLSNTRHFWNLDRLQNAANNSVPVPLAVPESFAHIYKPLVRTIPFGYMVFIFNA
jgi:hypothetical protein